MMETVLNTVQSLHPSIGPLVVTHKSALNDFDGLEKGLCDVAIASEAGFLHRQARESMCGFCQVGRPVVTYFTGFYATQWISGLVSTSIARLSVEGKWLQLETELFPPSMCGKSNQSENGGLIQLEAHHMIGNAVILGLVGVVALTVEYARKRDCTRKRAARLTCREQSKQEDHEVVGVGPVTEVVGVVKDDGHRTCESNDELHDEGEVEEDVLASKRQSFC